MKNSPTVKEPEVPLLKLRKESLSEPVRIYEVLPKRRGESDPTRKSHGDRGTRTTQTSRLGSHDIG